jgi:hypothetical protein
MCGLSAFAVTLSCACAQQAPATVAPATESAPTGTQNPPVAKPKAPRDRAYAQADASAEFPQAWAPVAKPLNALNPAHTSDRLLIKWIGVNRDVLRLDLGLDRADPALEYSLDGFDPVPRVELLVDGCAVNTSEFRLGRLGYKGPDLKVLLPRARLPKGELTFDFLAHGRRTSIMLLHDDHGLRPMEAEESVRHFEDREAGIEGSTGPDCNPDRSPKRPLSY